MALLTIGKGQEAQECSRTAVEILEKQPPGKELALAYRNQAFLENRNRNIHEANILAEKAVALAERFGDSRVLAMAYGTLGSNLLSMDFERGSEYLQRCLKIAHEAGLDARVAAVYANLGSTACELHRFETARRYLSEGIAYCAERDLDLVRFYMLAWQALTDMYLGYWTEAVELANEVLRHTSVSARNRLPAFLALGRLQSRIGAGGTRELLTNARSAGAVSDQFEDVALVNAALAEEAWLAGNLETALSEARALYDLAVDKQHTWLAGEAAFWLWRCGEQPTQYGRMAVPFQLQIAGEWQAAAEEWKRLACPYEQAWALADGDSEAQVAALKIFDRLGARPAADLLRQRLHQDGVVKIPRAPHASTRENPFGLTKRQVEVLGLLVEGLSNAAISARLHISPKTADHHVSAILGKMDLHSREEAASLARTHPHFSEK